MSAAGTERPQRRADCAAGARPCPWVGCRYHLLLDVSEAGNLTTSGPRTAGLRVPTRGHPPSAEDIERWTDAAIEQLERMGETCALDVADGGARTLEEIGDIIGVTRERVRQMVVSGQEHMLAPMRRKGCEP